MLFRFQILEVENIVDVLNCLSFTFWVFEGFGDCD